MTDPIPQSDNERPRAEWLSHPNYPDQVLLLGSHTNFRRISQQLVDQPAAPTGLLAQFHQFKQWKDAMAAHEHYEEHKLYRYLARRFDISTERLSAGHRELRHADDAVRSAFQEAIDADIEDKEVACKTLLAALRKHHEALLKHLTDEEDVIIPLMLDLPAPEFQEFKSTSIEELLDRL